jgi:hypothetical protein
MSNLRLSRANLEKAIAAFLISRLAEAAADNTSPNLANINSVPVHVRMGKLDENGTFELADIDDIPLPAVCVAVPRSERHPFGYSKCEMHVIVLGSVNKTKVADFPAIGNVTQTISEEGEDVVYNKPKEQHETIAGFIAECLAEQNHDTVLADLNPPEAGPDERTV